MSTDPTADSTADTAPVDLPVVRVDSGNPNAEDLGVLLALLAAGSGNQTESPKPKSRWSAPDVRLHRRAPGQGTWRFSGMPS
ncbi:MAG: acetyl-CoA carboxylase biotin carboxyl carrier protein subunit [Actinomycetales bacterium]|nr:MAG: acetyl-CoA carboxylase biotin carboxyl carrier protein subunit [Actinomycetales bacterium]